MLDKKRTYEILNTISNKKGREAVLRVYGELYAVYESGETLMTTDNRAIRKLIKAYRGEKGLPDDYIPALSEWVEWLVDRSGIPTLKRISRELFMISATLDQIGLVTMDGLYPLAGIKILSIRVWLNNIFTELAKYHIDGIPEENEK